MSRLLDSMVRSVLPDPRRLRAAQFMLAPIQPAVWARQEAARLGYEGETRTHNQVRKAMSWLDDHGHWPSYLVKDPRGHVPAQEYLRSHARKRVICANRRAAKTSTVGQEDAYNLITQDNWFTLVLCNLLSDFSQNWLARRPHGMIQMMLDGGLRQGTMRDLARGTAEFATHSTSKGDIRSVTFAWGSRLVVIVDPSDGRGSAPNHLIVDEAQKCEEAANALLADIGPAGEDRGMRVTFMGTPGHEVDTTFGRIANGANVKTEDYDDPEVAKLLKASDWKRFTWFSWDNIFFGNTWARRFKNHVINSALFMAEQYALTATQVVFLRDMTQEMALSIADHPMARPGQLHPDLLRELFGVWVREAARMVYALGLELHVEPYWDDWSPHITDEAVGHASYRDLMDAPRRWADRLARLPKDRGAYAGKTQPWRATLGVDLGFGDPAALSLAVTSVHDLVEYELDSAKASSLGEDELREIVIAWVRACLSLGIPVDAVPMDTAGGGARNIKESWYRKIADLFGPDVPVVAAEKHECSIERQVSLINARIRMGHKRYLRNSPLALELSYLQWKYPEEGKDGRRKQDKTRMVALPNGRKVRLGNDCADADRYRYYWSHHVYGEPVTAPVRPTLVEHLETHAMRGLVGGANGRSRSL